MQCAGALAFQYIARPLVEWAGAISGHSWPALPGIDDNLWQLMLGMLGLRGHAPLVGGAVQAVGWALHLAAPGWALARRLAPRLDAAAGR